MRKSVQGMFAGAAGVGVALGFGELIEGATESIPSLVVAVGELIADYTPGDVIAASIANLGSSQKTVLTVSIVIGSLVIGALLGQQAVRGRRHITDFGFAAFGLLGAWAMARNPFSPVVGSWVVALSASGLGVLVTHLLVSRVPQTAPAGAPSAETEAGDLPEVIDPSMVVSAEDPRVPTATSHARRSFIAYTSAATAAALAMVGIGRSLRGTSPAEQAREQIVLPPATPASEGSSSSATDSADTGGPGGEAAVDGATVSEADAAGSASNATQVAEVTSVQAQVAALDVLDDEVPGISSYVSPNDSFYRIDTALVVPQVDPADWNLRFTGMVDRPYELTLDEILAMDLNEYVITLSCVSNQVGGNLVGNAVWTGVPLADLLDRAGVQAGADQVVGRSVDDWTAGFPTDVVYDGRNAILAVGMNGEPLPTRHGFPARLVVAGLYGYVSAVKWIEEIQMNTWDGFDGYWVPRGWSKEGPMKTQSRIDVPRGGTRLTAGTATPIAGIAWAPTRGISGVEVNIDGTGWQQCRLGEALGDESWVQWHYEWVPEGGRHEIQVRATDGDGVTQSEGPVSPRPNGAEGWHQVTVNVDA